MKKKLLLACCTVALVLSACGGSSNNSSTTSNNAENQAASEQNNSESENSTDEVNNADNTEVDQEAAQEAASGAWTLQQVTDEFGDVKKDGGTNAVYAITGDFSNTATNGSELGGYVVFEPLSQSFFFILNEYNNAKATYLSSDTIVLKYKAGSDDTIHSHYLTGQAPNDALVLNDTTEQLQNNHHDYKSVDSGFTEVATNLWYGNEVRCIIEIANSKYNFSIEPSNFKDICTELGVSFEELPKEEAIRHSFEIYMQDTEYAFVIGNPIIYAVRHITPYATEENQIPESELHDFMVGRWAEYDLLSRGYAYCYEYKEDGSRIRYGEIKFSEDTHAHEEDAEKEWAIEDGEINIYDTHRYVIHDLGVEGYYYMRCTSDKNSSSWSRILIKLNDDCKPMYPLSSN